MQDEQGKPLIVLMRGVNGGRRGFLVRVKTGDLLAVLKPPLVEVALQD